MKVDDLLRDLESFGIENDRTQTDRSKRMLNITRDTGEMLAVLIKATGSRRILEIGTSNGYSTLWLAEAAQSIGGSVTTIERSEFKIALAKTNFERSGLNHVIHQIHDEAGSVLPGLPDSQTDLIFLDSYRTDYPAWWPHIRRALRPGGLLVVDNALTHREDLHPFVHLVEGDAEFSSCLVPIGHGEFLAVKNRD